MIKTESEFGAAEQEVQVALRVLALVGVLQEAGFGRNLTTALTLRVVARILEATEGQEDNEVGGTHIAPGTGKNAYLSAVAEQQAHLALLGLEAGGEEGAVMQ